MEKKKKKTHTIKQTNKQINKYLVNLDFFAILLS